LHFIAQAANLLIAVDNDSTLAQAREAPQAGLDAS